MDSQASMPRGVVVALGFVLALNYVDRSSLATAAPMVQSEFGLSSSQLGVLLSAFFWVYTPAQLLGGWLVHRFDVRLVMGLGVLLWGLATMLHGLASGFVMMFAMRLLLALGECVTFPGVQLLVNLNARIDERGKVSSIISSGQGLGPMLGTLFGGLAMAAFGWRAMFVGLGVATMLWLWPWWAVSRKGLKVAAAHHVERQVTYLEILKRREFWGMAMGMFWVNYAFYFVFIWLPSYVVKSGGFSVADMATIVGAIYGIYGLTTALVGHFADQQVKRGTSATRVWKGMLLGAGTASVVCIAGCAFVEARTAVWLLGFTGFFFGFMTPPLYAMTGTLPGPRAGGRWAGAQAVAGQLAGVASPIATGMLIDSTGSYYWPFLLAAMAMVLGLIGYCVVVRRVEVLTWSEPRAAAPATA